jgi:hypothetical protein
VLVHLAVEHALELKLTHLRFDGWRLAIQLVEGGLITFGLGHLQQLQRIAYGVAGTVELTQFLRQMGALAAQFLGALGLRPDVGNFKL